jgi:hypothetical protein
MDSPHACQAALKPVDLPHLNATHYKASSSSSGNQATKPLDAGGAQETPAGPQVEPEEALQDEELWGEAETLATPARVLVTEASAGVLPFMK